MVIAGSAAQLLVGSTRVLTTPDIVSEVRKRPESKAANRYIDVLESNGKVVTRSDFSDFPSGLDLLVSCAGRLAPVIQLGKQGYMLEKGLLGDDAEVRAVETAANEGTFLARPKLHDALNHSFSTLTGADIDLAGAGFDKGLRRSWHRYPTKRRKQRGGEYRFSAETLLATALAHAVLKGQQTCVLSDDTDCATIMKQLTDNLLWVITAAEFKLQNRALVQDAFVSRWGDWCRYVDRHRQEVGIQTALQAWEADDAQSSETDTFAPNTVLVCCHTNSIVSSYSFPDNVAEFIRCYQGGATWTGMANIGWLAGTSQ